MRFSQIWFLVSRSSYSSSFVGERVEERLDRVVEAARQVLAQAADPQVAREHPEAGEHLVDVEQQLPLAEAVHHHRDGADLEAVRAEPDQVAGDALQLGDQHADVLDALRHLDAEQPLDRQAERQAVGLRAEVVHPLDERDHLLPLLLLGGLLDAGVQVADRGVGAETTVSPDELQHQPQHAVRAGVLRPHVDGHRLGAKFRRLDVQASCIPYRSRARRSRRSRG